MKRLLLAVLLLLLRPCVCLPAQPPKPIVDQVHVVSVHVRDHAAFDAVFLLFRDALQLPVVYGSLSSTSKPNERLYAGFSVGNAYLEPCGPYADDAPFTAAQPARFVGLTFSPAGTLDADARELDRRNIANLGVQGGGNRVRFLYVNDPLLKAKRQAVSIWEIQDKQDRVNLDFLRSSLKQSGGGALGVKRMAEVRVEYPGKTHLDQWHNFLGPARHEDEVWFVGNGPAMRFVQAEEARLESVVLQVGSIKNARAVLEAKNMAAKSDRDSIEIDRSKACGLRIVLKE